MNERYNKTCFARNGQGPDLLPRAPTEHSGEARESFALESNSQRTVFSRLDVNFVAPALEDVVDTKVAGTASPDSAKASDQET